tara:strand:+ start:294 stop:713 length:420 start_codon:yes stop_codon:yes gene_type:complete
VIVKRFAQYITEKRMDVMYQRMPGAPSRIVKGLENPSPREVEASLKSGILRFVGTKDRLLVWSATEALHAQVAAVEFGLPLSRGGFDVNTGHDTFGKGMIGLHPFPEDSGRKFTIIVDEDEGRVLRKNRTFVAIENAKA